MAQPDDEDNTVSNARASGPARAVTEEEATRVEPPRPFEEVGGATEVAPESMMPILKQIRARAAESEREREPHNRLAPPVPPSPPRSPVPVPSAPTDPQGVAPFHPSAPTAPNPIITDEEATRLAPKPDKKKPKPGPPLVRRPAARQALQRIRRFTSEMSAISINSKSTQRRRVSRLLLITLSVLGVVVLIQVYKAFTFNNAEMAKPLGGRKVEQPGFFDGLFKL